MPKEKAIPYNSGYIILLTRMFIHKFGSYKKTGEELTSPVLIYSEVKTY